MNKKRVEPENKQINTKEKVKNFLHTTIYGKRTFGEKASDKLTHWAGSWTFIILFFLVVIVWIYGNSVLLLNYGKEAFDPFPFILLNLALSLLAAIQAPIILMSQNRQAQKDRIRAEYDYAVNRKAEKEITQIKKHLERMLEKHHPPKKKK